MFRSVFSRSLKNSGRFQVRLQSTAANATVDQENQIKRRSSQLSLIISSFILGAAAAQFFPLSSVAKFVISEKLPLPNTPEADSYKDNLEKKLQSLPIYQRLSQDKDFDSVRAWNYVDSNTLNQSLTGGTLAVPGGIAIKPVLFFNKATKESVTIIHVGEKLSGYPFLIHGGILATVLDEILKRSSSFQFGIDPINEYTPNKIKTNKIEIQYKFPTFANNFIIVKTKIVDGKVDGNIETTNGRLLVKGLGQFEPRSRPIDVEKPLDPTKRTKKFLGLF